MPLFVLQDSLCSVHAADVFPGSGRRLCSVNVKLTMRLGAATGLLTSGHSNATGFLQGPARLLHRRRQTDWSSRGGGGGGLSPGFLCAKLSLRTRKDFLRSLPFFRPCCARPPLT